MISYKKIFFLSLFAVIASTAGMFSGVESAQAQTCTELQCVPGLVEIVPGHNEYIVTNHDSLDGYCIPVYGWDGWFYCTLYIQPVWEESDCADTQEVQVDCPDPDPADPYCQTLTGTASCADYAGTYGIPVGSEGVASYSYKYCTSDGQAPTISEENVDATGCVVPVGGCIDPSATNYDSGATVDNGTCKYCTSKTGTASCSQYAGTPPIPANYTEGTGSYTYDACTQNGSYSEENYQYTGGCSAPISGCTDSSAINYNSNASVDNGSCTYYESCTDSGSASWGAGCYASATATISHGGTITVPNEASGYIGSQTYECNNGSYFLQSESCSPTTVLGCTDSSADNYRPSANTDDGSCTYSCSNGAANPTACNQCPDGLAYVGSSCATCNNGGCSGTGGSSGNPLGSLVCNNGATNPRNCTSFPPSPPTAALGISPSTIAEGQSATISWSSNNASSCSGGAGFITNDQTSGSVSTGVLNAGTYNYLVTCVGQGQPAYASASVEVISPSVSISANPARVQSGSQSQISWQGIDVSSCSVTGPNFSSSALSGSASRTITAQSLFSITCDGLTDSITVNIVPLFQEF